MRMRRIGRHTFVATLAVAASFATACGGGSSAQPGPRASQVEVAVATRDTLRVTVRAVGSLGADQRVELAAEVDGRVTGIDVEEGAEVRQGEVLLRIDEDQLRSQLRASAASLARARQEATNLERQRTRNETLLEQGAISQQAYDDLATRAEAAVADSQAAAANLALARTRLADATVRAPFAGRTGTRKVDLGQYVRIGDPLITLVDNDPLEIEFSVPERYLRRLAAGLGVEVEVASAPDRSYDGKVTFVSPEVDVASRAVTMKASIPNQDAELRAGQFANAVLVLKERPDALIVPEAAIVPRGGESLVFVVRDGEAHRHEVRLGAREPGRVQILEGITPGDTVVVAGQQRLADGTPVRVGGQESSARAIGDTALAAAGGTAGTAADTAEED